MVSAVVHDLSQSVAAARAAATNGKTITVRSAPGVGRGLGVAGWLALVKLTRQQVPSANVTFTFDPGDWPGDAYAAIAGGAEQIALAQSSAFTRLLELAKQEGVKIDDRDADIDLAFHHDPEEACNRLLLTTKS